MKHIFNIILTLSLVVIFAIAPVSAKAAPPPVTMAPIVPGMSQDQIDEIKAEYEREVAEREQEEAVRKALQRKVEKSYARVRRAASIYYDFDEPYTEPDSIGFHFFISRKVNVEKRELSEPIWVNATVNNKGGVRFIVGKRSYSEKSFIKALKAKKF